ncbi:hypothetical protein NQZ68_035001 [Dissostichus eleginoides]|nr:hypothetical protein NQZ68_035001 [Dissostichus eleginoides]
MANIRQVHWAPHVGDTVLGLATLAKLLSEHPIGQSRALSRQSGPRRAAEELGMPNSKLVLYAVNNSSRNRGVSSDRPDGETLSASGSPGF